MIVARLFPVMVYPVSLAWLPVILYPVTLDTIKAGLLFPAL